MMPARYRKEWEFAWVMAAMATAVALWPLLGGAPPDWPWLLAALLPLALAWHLPRQLTPLAQGWLRLGHLLGQINTWLLLGVVFFVLITPLALLMRLSGRDALRLKRKSQPSYWLRQERRWPPESFKDQF